MIASEGVAEVLRSIRKWLGTTGFDQAVERAKKDAEPAGDWPTKEFDPRAVAELIRIFSETDQRRRKQVAKLTDGVNNAVAAVKAANARVAELERCLKRYAEGLEDKGKAARIELGEND